MLYVHHVPGRLRVRTARLKSNPQLSRTICNAMIAIEGVLEVRANPVTGSLTVSYDRDRLSAAVLWEALRERHLVSGKLPIADPSGVTRAEFAAPAGPGQALFEAVAGVVLNKLLERSAVALVGALI